MRTSLKGKTLLREGANFFPLRADPEGMGKSLLPYEVSSIECYYFYYTSTYTV